MISFKDEKVYIEGTKKPVKLSILEQSLDYLPEKMNMFYDKLKICFEKFKVNINETLSLYVIIYKKQKKDERFGI